jgi:cobalamin biosynthesis Mg chelatase CobN
MPDDPRGCAVNVDGSLKDAADIDFVHSEADDLPPPKPAASSSTLPQRSTRPDRLTQTRFNLANGDKRGPALIVSGARQAQKRKAKPSQSKAQSKKSRKTAATSDAASTSRKRASNVTIPDSSDESDDNPDGSDGDVEDVGEDEVTKYERLRKEGEHDRAVSRAVLFSICLILMLLISETCQTKPWK